MRNRTTSTTVTVSSLLLWERVNNSYNGNPRYRFVLVDTAGGVHAGTTRPDYGFVYALGHSPKIATATIATTPTGRCYMDGATEAD